MIKRSELLDSALLKSLSLKALSHIDDRSDEEIEASFLSPTAVSSEKNVWAYWTTGWSTMRPWTKRNVIGWVRLLGPSWSVRVLDKVPGSSANVSRFIDPKLLPDAFKNNSMTGRATHTQGSDMVRLAVLFQWGGVYMDVSIMLFMHLDDICWRSLQHAGSRFQIALPSIDPLSASGRAGSFFLAARRGSGFIKRWNDIFKAVWENRVDVKDIHTHALFRHLINKDNGDKVRLEASADALDYFAHILSYERVRGLEDSSDGFSGPDYCRNKILLIAYHECASAALLTNDDGEKQFRLLGTDVTPQAQNDEWVRAKEFAYHLLSTSAMMKLAHHNGRDTPSLATLWDRKENDSADIAPGSFAEFLRQTTAFFSQDRTIDTIKFPINPKEVFSLGVLEEYDDEVED